jgi:hypothetical protein
MQNATRAILLCAAVICSAATKFSKSANGALEPGCGRGPDEHSPLGGCVNVGGINVSAQARGGHICVVLPRGKTDKDMILTPEAAIAPYGAFEPCGNPANRELSGYCSIDYSRYEGREYYPDTNELCGRFKNWSSDRKIKIRINVAEK